MRQFLLGLALSTLSAFAFSLMLAGCGNKDTGSSAGGGSSGGGSADQGAQKQDLKVLEPGKGVLKGKIALKGQPDVKALTEKLHADMKQKDTDYCMNASETEKTQQEYRISDKGGLLGNVFVWILPEKGTFFKVDDKQLAALEKKVKVRQPRCAFVPHCQFLFSEYHPNPKKPRETKATGQVWEIANDATISHNTNWGGGSRNKGDNVLLAKGSNRVVDNLVPESSEVTIKCNIHPWMKAHMRVVDTPYFALSLSDTLDGKDKVEKSDPRFGTYEIKGLPAGKVRVLAWHEECGFLNKGSGQGEDIEIKADTPTEKDFEATK